MLVVQTVSKLLRWADISSFMFPLKTFQLLLFKNFSETKINSAKVIDELYIKRKPMNIAI